MVSGSGLITCSEPLMDDLFKLQFKNRIRIRRTVEIFTRNQLIKRNYQCYGCLNPNLFSKKIALYFLKQQVGNKKKLKVDKGMKKRKLKCLTNFMNTLIVIKSKPISWNSLTKWVANFCFLKSIPKGSQFQSSKNQRKFV